MFDDAADVGINQMGEVEYLIVTSSAYMYRPHNGVQAENLRIL
jgi:hypothetical protein